MAPLTGLDALEPVTDEVTARLDAALPALPALPAAVEHDLSPEAAAGPSCLPDERCPDMCQEFRARSLARVGP